MVLIAAHELRLAPNWSRIFAFGINFAVWLLAIALVVDLLTH